MYEEANIALDIMEMLGKMEKDFYNNGGLK